MNIQKHYDSVYRFNDIADNLNNVTIDKLKAQMKVVVEEIGELQDAFDNRDAVELLDGACDGFVTLMGLIQQMEKVGFKVDEALQRVCDNNLSKFTDYVDEESEEYYAQQGWTVTQNFEYDCCVLKDNNGKIRKPIGFKSVEISDLVPFAFFETKMSWDDAIEKAVDGGYVFNNSKMQYFVDGGKIHWTHFGSVGGLLSKDEVEKLRSNTAKDCVVRDKLFGGAV